MTTRKPESWAFPIIIGLMVLLPSIQYGRDWEWWLATLTGLTGWVLVSWGVLNLLLFVVENGVEYWRQVREADFLNGSGGMLRLIKEMSEPQLRTFARVTGGAWIVKLRAGGGPEYALGGAEEVPLEFVKFIVDHSTTTDLYPQNRFSEGAYAFDQVRHQLTDRELYKKLLLWLCANGMAEWPRGNQPAKWRAGWTPQLVAEALDLDAFTYDEIEGARPIALDLEPVGRSTTMTPS